MESVFFITFGVGIGYVVLSFALGNLLDLGDFEGGEGSGAFGFLRPAPISAFLIVFGGIGLLFYDRFGFFVALGIAIVAGLCISYFLVKFILMPLHKAQNTSTIEKEQFIGHAATVSSKILKEGFGKISFHVNGSNFTSPAKCVSGDEIPTGKLVEIVYIENNTYFVKESEA